MAEHIPQHLTIPTINIYQGVRKYQKLDSAFRDASEARSRYMSRDIIAPYIDLRDHLEDIDVHNIMMKDIANVIIANPSIIELLKAEASKEVAA